MLNPELLQDTGILATIESLEIPPETDEISSSTSMLICRNIVYILINRIFRDQIIKIGRTNKDLRQRLRELSKSTSIPLDFEVYYAAEVQDCSLVESQLHAIFADYRINPDKEFFQLDPEKAKMALQLAAIKEVTLPKTTVPTSSTIHAGLVWETFDVPIGAEIIYVRDPSKKATVVAPKKLEYLGERYSLQGLSNKLLSEGPKDGTNTCIGAREWMYDGELLDLRRSAD